MPPVKYHSRASAMVLLPVPLSPYTARLCPSPKSTSIVSGTPRKERIVSRWTLSVTGVLLDELPDGVGTLFNGLQGFRRLLDEPQEALAAPPGALCHPVA